MNFRSLTQIFGRTRSAPLTYEECPTIGRKKILIVDDNSDLRKLLALVLKNSDYDTVEAERGLEALNQERATRPDLILIVVHSEGAVIYKHTLIRPYRGCAKLASVVNI